MKKMAAADAGFNSQLAACSRSAPARTDEPPARPARCLP